MGGGPSGISKEDRRYAKAYAKIKETVKEIKDDKFETLMGFDNDGNLLFRTTDNKKNEVGYGTTDDELLENYEKSINAITVHNHPNGSCFSSNDLVTFQHEKESWAITKDFIQVFRWNHNTLDKEGFKQDSEKRNKFLQMVRQMEKDGGFWNEARAEYEKTHVEEAKRIDAIKSVNEQDKAFHDKAQRIKQLALEKQRKFFSNHAKEYGYYFSYKRW